MQESTPQSGSLFWVDLVRVVATWLVVLVHVSGQVTNAWGQVPEAEWEVANVYGGLARICVALFFMISGYLLLPRSESLGTFYRRRLPKVVIPWLAWSWVYLGLYCGTHPGACTPGVVRDLLLVRGTYYHLWFLYNLIGIYLILPVLRRLVGPTPDHKLLWYLIGLWLVFQPILGLAREFWGLQVRLTAPLATGFVGFVILGYLLGNLRLRPWIIGLSAGLWLLGTAVTILGTQRLTRLADRFDGFFYELMSLNVVVAAAAAFLLLRWIAAALAASRPEVQQLARQLAAGTFGIYLVHVLVIEVLRGAFPGQPLDALGGHPAWSIPLMTWVVFAASWLLTRGLQQVPLLKYIVPG